MILIAESGSTKTDWRLIQDDGTVGPFSTVGFNPFYVDSDAITSGIRADLPARVDPQRIQSVHFYGAGCSSADKRNIILRGLKAVFPKAILEVNHDLLAAARALFMKESGIAVIIGTGSNTCFFDGSSITTLSPSLGYILGDEGSGAWLGARLLRDYLRKDLPPDLRESFNKEYSLTKDSILDAVYCTRLPNRFLASFAPFLVKNVAHPYVEKMVYHGFSLLFGRHLCKYKDLEPQVIRCVGSVAHHFQTILHRVAKEQGSAIDRILEYPIDGLVKFHRQKTN